jgi:hypothetical protein
MMILGKGKIMKKWLRKTLAFVLAGAIALGGAVIATMQDATSVEAADAGSSFATAITLNLGAETVLQPKSYGKFTLPQPGIVTVDGTIRHELDLYDQYQSGLDHLTYGGRKIGLAAGTYYLYNPEKYNTNTVKVQLEARNDFETEPNNSLATANVLTRDKKYYGLHSYYWGNDWGYDRTYEKGFSNTYQNCDYWTFTANVGENVKVYLNEVDDNLKLKTDSYMRPYVFDPDGLEVKTISGKDDFGNYVMIKNTLAGKYYVKENSSAFTYSIMVSSNYPPVYRLFNPRSGEHLYTRDLNEKKTLLSQNWGNDEGIKWYSPLEAISGSTPVYRVFNPRSGEHVL